MIESIMNEFDIMAKLGTSDRGKSESIFGDWTWKDCRLYEAVQLATEYISEGDHPYQGSVESLTMLLDNKNVNVLIMQGELDY